MTTSIYQKSTFINLIFYSLLIVSLHCQAQGFVNLNFEDAAITLDSSSPYYPNAVYASDAIPGWSATGFIGPNDIYYNNLTLGAPCVAIVDTNGSFHALPIEGTYSIILYGGSGSASISQSADVPISAESILFKAQGVSGTLLVSLGGENISFSAISTGSNYTLYGGNIPSNLVGQNEQLTFLASTGVNNVWEIDDIQFSSTAVPEPSTLGLAALGGVFLAWRRWQKASRG